MIKYALLCADGHDFEGWFASSSGYERQAEAGQIACPVCGGGKVSKAMMAPNIATSEKRDGVGPPPVPREVVEMLRAVRRHVVENADYVGPRFAEEARKIHFGETEPRGIYGEATVTEAKALLNDGVEVCPLPKLPDEQN
jgi:hypothetical protein